MEKHHAGEVTRLLVSWSNGDKHALDQLIPLLYHELRRISADYLRRERPEHTLQPTALVHEAYLRLVDQTQIRSSTRAQFFGIASNLMRQILVNYAERHRAAKRGGGNKITLEDRFAATKQPDYDLLVLDQALSKLARLNPRQSKVIELRFFGGLNEDEIAEVLDVSPITVKRDWRIARAALHEELYGGGLE